MRVNLSGRSSAERCPLCREALEGTGGRLLPTTVCGGCGTRYHRACQEELGECATYGCPGIPPVRLARPEAAAGDPLRRLDRHARARLMRALERDEAMLGLECDEAMLGDLLTDVGLAGADPEPIFSLFGLRDPDDDVLDRLEDSGASERRRVLDAYSLTEEELDQLIARRHTRGRRAPRAGGTRAAPERAPAVERGAQWVVVHMVGAGLIAAIFAGAGGYAEGIAEAPLETAARYAAVGLGAGSAYGALVGCVVAVVGVRRRPLPEWLVPPLLLLTLFVPLFGGLLGGSLWLAPVLLAVTWPLLLRAGGLTRVIDANR